MYYAKVSIHDGLEVKTKTKAKKTVGLSAQLLEKHWLRLMVRLTQGAGVWRRGKGRQRWINEVRQDNKDLETQTHGGVYTGDNKNWKITLGSSIRK